MEIRPEFGSVALNEEGQAKSQALRERFSDLLDTVEGIAGPGRESALARTALQEAHGWAQKALSLTTKYTKVLAWLFVGAVGLGALPAFAQEAAPSVQAENWVQALLGIVVTGVILPLARELYGWVKAKTEGTRLSNAVAALGELVFAHVTWIHLKLQEAAADGKVTPDEWKAIATELVAQLPAQTRAILVAQFGDGVVPWVASRLIERFAVHSQAAAAAAAAVAAVPNADAAMASRRAMAKEAP